MAAEDSVLQSWVQRLPFKMQTTLLTGIRGPDTHQAPNVKRLTKWMRGLVVKPGDPNNLPFMNVRLPDRILEKSDSAIELEFCTQHFYSHLMHCLEIIGYQHPKTDVAEHAYCLYADMCRLLHLNQESQHAMWERLGEKHWPGGVHPDNIEEAMILMASNPGWTQS